MTRFYYTLPLIGFDFSLLFSCQLLMSTGVPEVSNKCWTCSFFKTRELRLEYLKEHYIKSYYVCNFQPVLCNYE